MSRHASTDLLSDLDSLLEIERDALLGGDFDKIAEILDKKSELVDALNGIDELDGVPLGELKLKVSRNHEMIASSLKGIRAVADRMGDLRRARREMTTYNSKGQKNTVKTKPSGKLERRA